MSEGRVFWHYTCPICDQMFPYGMFAGDPVRICAKCKDKKEVEFLDSVLKKGRKS